MKKMIHEHHQKDSEDLFCCLAVIHEKQDQNWNDSLISTLPGRKHNTRKVIWCHRTLEWPNLLFLKSTDIKRGDRMKAWTDGRGYRPTQLYMKEAWIMSLRDTFFIHILTLLDLWFIYIQFSIHLSLICDLNISHEPLTSSFCCKCIENMVVLWIKSTFKAFWNQLLGIFYYKKREKL